MISTTELTVHVQFLESHNSYIWAVPALRITSDNVLQWNQVSRILEATFLKWKSQQFSCTIRAFECNKSQLDHPTGTFDSKWDEIAIDTIYKIVQQISLRLQSLELSSTSQLDWYFSSLTGSIDCMRILRRGNARIRSVRLYGKTSGGSTSSQTLLQEILLPHCEAQPQTKTLNISHQLLLDSIKDDRTRVLITEMIQVSNDDDTHHKPWIIILRGIPGSGKSTVARDLSRYLSQIHWKVSICSADLYFERRRGYRFDRNELHKAHKHCFGSFKRDILSSLDPENRDSQHVIVLDNTNVTRREYVKYIDTSRNFCCGRVRIVEVQCSDIGTAYAMAKRNSHGVPISRVLQMWMRWEEDTRSAIVRPVLSREEDCIMAFLTHRLGFEAWSGGPRCSLPNVLYVCLFLPQQERNKIIDTFPPKFRRVLAHHVTLFYNPTREYLRSVNFGSNHIIQAVNICSDVRAHVLKVELDPSSDLLLRQKYPHITYSLAPKVRPVYSGALLKMIDESVKKGIKTEACFLPIDMKLGIQLNVNGASISHVYRSFPWYFRCPTSSKACWSLGKTIQIKQVVVVYVDSPPMTFDLNLSVQDLVQRLICLQRLKHHIGSLCTSLRILCIRSSEQSDAKEIVFLDSIFAPLRPNQLKFHVCEQFISEGPVAEKVEAIITQLVCDVEHIEQINIVYCTFHRESIVLEDNFWLCSALATRFQHSLICYVPLCFSAALLDSMEPRVATCKMRVSSSIDTRHHYRLLDAMDLLDIGPSELIQTQIAQIAHHLAQAVDHAVPDNDIDYTICRVDTSLVALDALESVDMLIMIKTPTNVCLNVLRDKITDWLRIEGNFSHCLVIDPFIYVRLCATSHYVMQHFRLYLCYDEDPEFKGDDPMRKIEEEWKKRYEHCRSQLARVKSQLPQASELFVLLVAFIREVLNRRLGSHKLSTDEGKSSTSIESFVTIASEILVYEFLLQNVEMDNDALKLLRGLECICGFWKFLDRNWERLALLLREKLEMAIQHTSKEFFEVIGQASRCLSVKCDQDIRCIAFDVSQVAKRLFSMLYGRKEFEAERTLVNETDVKAVGEELSRFTLT
ncbi:unnamed protein product [Albugo candida]|uniref:tRNA ligase phosphodiesterase domain-containing protein n=1 Tax=Albugo candida TaxID=65357 RepID=A0A024G682_9STRA|nr:unnamed protein product [Albugo candida]|eukprot:CCI42178.1 unnamed protein product [Albugo candida]